MACQLGLMKAHWWGIDLVPMMEIELVGLLLDYLKALRLGLVLGERMV